LFSFVLSRILPRAGIRFEYLPAVSPSIRP
jgi:hypothetical protein